MKASGIEARARQWWGRLEQHAAPPVCAMELYAGDHWRIIRELPAVAVEAGFSPQLWIASAGYGLIPSNAVIHPYSATFAPGKPDSVTVDQAGLRTRAQHQHWWDALSRMDCPAPRAPRQVQHLAESGRNPIILIVASPSYVAALEKDLVRAAQALHRPERLIIISARSSISRGTLAPHWVPSSAHLQARLGGARLSLHARVARKALQRARHGILDARELRGYYGRLIQGSHPLVRYERTPMTDDDVRAFIAQALRTDPLSCSATLRKLRDSGHACEQQRFKRLFLELRGCAFPPGGAAT
ncbi:hypothetical protein POL68_17240 [Stigmatella sp. ncwal1]|uniref:Uncharacterized protein n=1 Tax=Stigmatella ashevillensis TaxID=2995309 RepID=A0ABT5DAU0_9BACT|nr:hypothetical protein [Stigmatella ashevillena]MDC0710225.1 hypothetical protein [Stigmatella ashevillena]